MQRKKAPWLWAILIICLPLGAASGDEWTRRLPSTLDELAAGYYLPNLTAAFGTFTYGHSGLATPFSRFLEERLKEATAKCSRVKVFDRAAAAAMDPAFKALYGELFASNEVGALLYGRYVEEGGVVRVRIELTGLSDGLLIGTKELLIPRSDLPAGLAVAPQRSATRVLEGIETLLPPADARDFQLSISTERGDGAAYREGEELVALIGIDRDAWVKVYHVDVEGRLSLIWPNRFGGGSGFLAAGAAVRIPGPDDPFKFRMTPPFGTEFLKAVASTTPFSLKEADFSPLASGEGDSRQLITRGLSVQPSGSDSGPSPALAEAIASYVILPAE